MLLSIITPTYNRADYLPDALASVRASVLAGGEAAWEHLVFDGASDDATPQILREAAAHDDRLHVHTAPEQCAASQARNLLIEAAKGEWIVPLDADDVLLQRCLFNYGALARRHPEARWFVADFLRVDAERRYLPGQDYYAWQFETPADMLRAIFGAEHFIQGNGCYSRQLWREVGGYDEGLEMAEDLDLYVRFLLAGAMPVVSSHLSHLHRFHGRNVSIGGDANRQRGDLATIYGKYADRLMELGVGAP